MNTDTAARHIARAMRQQFAQNNHAQLRRNAISGDLIPLRYLVEMDRQTYDARQLQRWADINPTVPHSRRELTQKELAMIDVLARQEHPTHAFRHKRVVEDALKNREVQQLCNLAVRMGKYIAAWKVDWRKTGWTFQKFVPRWIYNDLDIVDEFLQKVGYRLQGEEWTDGPSRILFNSFQQLKSVRGGTTQDWRFFFVPHKHRGFACPTMDEPAPGVIAVLDD